MNRAKRVVKKIHVHGGGKASYKLDGYFDRVGLSSNVGDIFMWSCFVSIYLTSLLRLVFFIYFVGPIWLSFHIRNHFIQ